MLVQGLVVQGKGSTVPVESHYTPTCALSTSQPPISAPSRRPIRHEFVVPRPRSPTQTNVADEAASTSVDVKKLEKTIKSSKARRRAKIVVSNDEEDLEDSSKQGRKIDEIDQDPNISLVQHDAETQERYGQEMEYETGVYTAEDVSTARPVSTTGAAVTTASASISIVSPPRVSTAEDISTAETLVYIRRSASKDKGKCIMQESESEQTKTKLQQRQERLEYEAVVRLQGQLDEEERQRIASVEESASSFNLAAGSSKRNAEEELDKESSKKQKIRESSESRDKEVDELSQEQLQQLMIIVSEQRMNVEALQTKYPIIDLEVYTEDTRKYWKIIRVGNHTERLYDTCGVHHVSTKDEVDIYMLVERDYPLSRGVLTQMLCAKLLLEQDSKISRELLKKIFIQVERPRR
ncbi:hypothetical protein Tco_1298984 [Tanacetum coccineum]